MEGGQLHVGKEQLSEMSGEKMKRSHEYIAYSDPHDFFFKDRATTEIYTE